jgi:hypothetical protein
MSIQPIDPSSSIVVVGSLDRIKFTLRPAEARKNSALFHTSRTHFLLDESIDLIEKYLIKIVPSKKFQKFVELSGKNKIVDFHPDLKSLHIKKSPCYNTR